MPKADINGHTYNNLNIRNVKHRVSNMVTSSGDDSRSNYVE